MSVALGPPTTPYEDHRDHVLGVLATRCGWVPSSDRESLYHEAYASMLDLERAGRLEPRSMHPRQVRAYLTKAAVNKALDERKRAEVRLTEPLDRAAENRPDASRPVDERALASFDSGAVREIVSGLSQRQQAVVQLRFCLELEPAEIQRLLDISARGYRKALERAVRKIAARYELVREGRWCETRRSLVLAYVAGTARPRAAFEARAHLAACPGCARMAGELRQAAERTAAALPVPNLATQDGLVARAGDALVSARETVADLGAGAKQQAASLAGRVSDPTPLAGARPGAAAAAIAGCIAVGSGATYCAVEGVPDAIRAPLGIKQTADDKPAPTQRSEPDPKPTRPEEPAPISYEPAPAPAPVPAPEVPKPEPEPEPQPAPSPAPAPQPPPPTPQEQASQEFGIEQSQPAQASPPSRDFSVPAQPAGEGGGGSSAGAGQEFGFEN